MLGAYQGTMRAKSNCGWMRGDLLADIRYRGGFPSDEEVDRYAAGYRWRAAGPINCSFSMAPWRERALTLLRDAAGDIRYLRFGSRLNPRLD